MPEADDGLIDELAASIVEPIPIVGGILAVFTKRGFNKVREEWTRNSSKALQAAERMSGLSREDLADRISENPRLFPLVIRVLYTAGMTGQDTILRALGAALGDAVRNPEKIDEAELLLIGMANLRKHHITILEIMAKYYPDPAKPDAIVSWTPGDLAAKSTYNRDLVNICIAGLVQSGLVGQVGDAYGVCYQITSLGRTAIEVLDTLDKESHNKPPKP